MKTKKLTVLAATMTAFLLFTGCKKEKTGNAENNAFAPQVTCEGMLHFNSSEEFAETQQKVMTMGEVERRDWERQHGFKSYATKCYELLEEFEAKDINSEEDVYNFVKENSKYFYIYEEDGEKTVKCRLSASPYFYLVNEESLVQAENQFMKAFDEGVVYCSTNYLDQIKQVNTYSESTFSDKMSCVQLNQSIQNEAPFIQNLSKQDNIVSLGNTTAYKGLRASRTSSSEGNRNTIELLEMETYYPPMDNTPAQFFTHLFIHNYPEHRVAGMWFACQRQKSFAVTVTWATQIYANPVTQTQNYTVIDDGGYNTNETLEFLPMQIISYSFDLFKGSAYTYDTPYMMNFNSNLNNFGF